MDVTPQRIAVAALLRIGEPGDGLLKALVDAAGPVTAVELIRAISSGAVAVDEVVGAAVRCGADAIYPGYGFLSENQKFAAALDAAGITFIGPHPDVLHMTGNKATAIAAATAAASQRRGSASTNRASSAGRSTRPTPRRPA